MRVLNYSEVRNNLKTAIDQVVDDADFTVISRRDAPDAVLMSLETFNGMTETMYLLSNPANAAHLARSLENDRTGNTFARELVDD
jgi:antitoxin YefM